MTAQTDTVRTNGVRSSVLQSLAQRTNYDNGKEDERRSLRERRDQPGPNWGDDVQNGHVSWAVPGFSIGEGRVLTRCGMLAKMWPYLL